MALRNTFRYIDDITSINDGGMFENNIRKIYPASLELKKVNTSSNHADVLDICVKIEKFRFISKVYDKRLDFSFSVKGGLL